MIGKKTLKNYEFRAIENYFDYIEDSIINGNFSQVKDLFNKLSKSQKRLSLKYFVNNTETLNYLLNLI